MVSKGTARPSPASHQRRRATQTSRRQPADAGTVTSARSVEHTRSDERARHQRVGHRPAQIGLDKIELRVPWSDPAVLVAHASAGTSSVNDIPESASAARLSFFSSPRLSSYLLQAGE
jgi:hypothetical protein